MRHLVIGGTGTVGSQVARELVRRGEQVAVLTRDGSKPVPEGTTAVVGNLLEPATVRRIFNDVDGVFLINTVSPTESHEALLALCGMRLARIERLVYLSVQNADKWPWLPHFGSKAGIEHAIAQSGIPYTVLRPNNFYQNDYWWKDVIVNYGIYPQPIGSRGVSRVDVRDIAEAAAIALTSAGHEGQTYDLVGPEAVTGDSTAAAWSRALGKPIKYGGDDLDAWESQAVNWLPDWMAFDFREMFHVFQQEGFQGSREAVERMTRLIGHAPRPFDAFAEEAAAAWRS